MRLQGSNSSLISYALTYPSEQLFLNSKITSLTQLQYSFLQLSIFSRRSRWIIILLPLPVSKISFLSDFSLSLALRQKHVQLAVSIWLKGLLTVSQQMIQLTVLISFSMLKEVGFLFYKSQQQLFLYLLPKVLMQVHTTSFNLVNQSLLVTIIFSRSNCTSFPQQVF